jgi:dihydrofolate reductase
MARTLYSVTMSLDGFIAGAGGDMQWLTAYLGDEDPRLATLVQEIGALIIGYRTYTGDDPNAGTDAEGAFGGRYDGPVVVLTHRPPDDPPPGVEFVTDLHEAVARVRELAGDRDVNILGADVAAQCLDAGLLDEVVVFFAPVLLGDGTPLFRRPGGRQVHLERVPGETEHWYRVIR